MSNYNTVSKLRYNTACIPYVLIIIRESHYSYEDGYDALVVLQYVIDASRFSASVVFSVRYGTGYLSN